MSLWHAPVTPHSSHSHQPSPNLNKSFNQFKFPTKTRTPSSMRSDAMNTPPRYNPNSTPFNQRSDCKIVINHPEQSDPNNSAVNQRSNPHSQTSRKHKPNENVSRQWLDPQKIPGNNHQALNTPPNLRLDCANSNVRSDPNNTCQSHYSAPNTPPNMRSDPNNTRPILYSAPDTPPNVCSDNTCPNYYSAPETPPNVRSDPNNTRPNRYSTPNTPPSFMRLDPVRFKTELCRSVHGYRNCQYGARCRFAHSVDELRSPVRHYRYRTKLCYNYHHHGVCNYGTRCSFIHSLDGVDNIQGVHYNVDFGEQCEQENIQGVHYNVDFGEQCAQENLQGGHYSVDFGEQCIPGDPRALQSQDVHDFQGGCNSGDLGIQNIQGGREVRNVHEFGDRRMIEGGHCIEHNFQGRHANMDVQINDRRNYDGVNIHGGANTRDVFRGPHNIECGLEELLSNMHCNDRTDTQDGEGNYNDLRIQFERFNEHIIQGVNGPYSENIHLIQGRPYHGHRDDPYAFREYRFVQGVHNVGPRDGIPGGSSCRSWSSGSPSWSSASTKSFTFDFTRY